MSDSGIYFKEGKVIAESGQARVYEYNNDLFLEVGDAHTLWAMSNELEDYMDQLEDFPRGSVLEIGLGLGVASRYLLSFPKVRTLVTVEKNQDVIDIYQKILPLDKDFIETFGDKTHLILNTDGLSYVYSAKRKYDFIFLDFYRAIDEDTLPDIADMVLGSKRVLAPSGKIFGWFDKYTPDEYRDVFFDLFK